jgi:hypothetical protein
VYLLYIDESDTGESEDGGRRYCVCGVYVTATSYGATTDRLTKLIASWDPPLPPDFEVKGHDLFHGQGAWRKRPAAERAAFAKALADVVAGSNLRLFVAERPSKDFTEDYRVLLTAVVTAAAKQTANTGTRTGRQLMVIFDQRPDIDPRVSDLRAVRANVIRDHAKSCRFIDHGFESDSRHAPLIQLADFVAYHLRRHSTMTRDDSLLATADDHRVVGLLDEIETTVRPKVRRLKVNA